MSSWESIPNNKKESIVKSLYRFDRIQKRKKTIKRLFNVLYNSSIQIFNR